MPPPPAGWPADVAYLSKWVVSDHLKRKHPHIAEHLQADTWARRTPGPPPPTLLGTAVKLKRISDKNHPACGQYGLFAYREIEPHAHVCDYIGVVRDAGEPESESSDYALAFDDHGFASDDGEAPRLCVDAQQFGNEGRMVNDFRGVAKETNVKFGNRLVGSGAAPRLALFAGPRGVKKGQECVASYGKGYWSARVSDVADMHRRARPQL